MYIYSVYTTSNDKKKVVVHFIRQTRPAQRRASKAQKDDHI